MSSTGGARSTPTAAAPPPPPGLAGVLPTPLLIYLAQAAYRGPAARPASLCDETTYPDPEAIESHLLQRYLPGVYAPAVPSDRLPDTGTRYPADQAQRALRFLARFLERLGTTVFVWWHLPAVLFVSTDPPRHLNARGPPGAPLP